MGYDEGSIGLFCCIFNGVAYYYVFLTVSSSKEVSSSEGAGYRLLTICGDTSILTF